MYVENATFVCRGLTETRDVYLQSWVNMGHQKDGLAHRERATLLWVPRKITGSCVHVPRFTEYRSNPRRNGRKTHFEPRWRGSDEVIRLMRFLQFLYSFIFRLNQIILGVCLIYFWQFIQITLVHIIILQQFNYS